MDLRIDPRVIATREELEHMLNDAGKPKPLHFLLLKDITNDFSEDKIIGRGGSAVVYKGSIGNRTVAVKRLSTPYMHEEQFEREIKCLMKVKHENIVQFLGYCSDTQGCMASYDGKLVMAGVQERLLCFEYLCKGSLDKHMTDELEWKQRYQIIIGVCQGLHRLHKDPIFHLDLKPGNILLDENMLPKIADFGLARCLDKDQTKIHTENIDGTWAYLAPELKTSDGVITVKSITVKSDLYSLGVIIMEILTGGKGSDRCRNVDDVIENWNSRMGESLSSAQLDQIKVCSKIGIECSDINPANRPADTTDIINRLGNTGTTQESQESSKLLHVHPALLVFDLQPGKLIPCSLQLTNDKDEHVAFKLSTTQTVDWSEHFMARLPIFGVVTARSTYTLILTVSEWGVPDKRTCDLVLESCISPYNHIVKFRDIPECEEHFNVHKGGNAVHKEKLTAFLSLKGQSTPSKPTGSGIKVLYMERPRIPLFSLDAHPSNPWIITGHTYGNVRIWNHETKSLLDSFKVSQQSVYSVKFIARKQWFICGTAEGLIHVYSYEKGMQKITSFRAHDGYMLLEVHPTQPYVLSWPCLLNHEKKLWGWEKGWKCTQTFEREHRRGVVADKIAFDPKSNLFASTSDDTVKVWSLDSPKSNYTLPKNFNEVYFLEFFTCDDQQYLVLGNDDNLMVWDIQMKNYVHNKLQTDSVFSHHKLSVLLTPTSYGTSNFWSSKDFRLEGVLDYAYGGTIHGMACLMGPKKWFVIGQEVALTILGIDNEKYQKDSRETSEPLLCADTRTEDTNSEVITQGSNELLHVHPRKLHFPFHTHKLIPCSLNLTNNTDKHVAFRLSLEKEAMWSWHPFVRMPLSGIVPSRSTYTLVVTVGELAHLQQEQNFNLILQSSISGDKYIYTFQDQSDCDQFFEDAKEAGNVGPEVKLKAVLSLQEQAMSENGSTGEDVAPPLINIWGLFHPKNSSGFLCSLDADPTESWIITGHLNGDVSIWKCGTQRMMSSINTWEGTGLLGNILNTQYNVYSVKFITRRRWFVAGTYDGSIHVYNYDTRMDLVKRFKVHSSGIRDNVLYSARGLVVHPNQPYVLSTIGEMKLWDWDKDWKCIQTFEREHIDTIRQVAFSLKDNTFASASSDHTIKLWRLDSSTSEHTLRGHSDKVNCLEFFTRDGRQHLITGSQDCTAKIWGLETKTCVHTMDVFMSPVSSVISLPDTPYLITGCEDGTVHLWNCTSFRLERIFNIGSGPVGSLCSLGSKRVVIQQAGEISIMDIDTISETSSSAPSNDLIEVDPPELRFPDVKEVSSTLEISNITYHHVAFSLCSLSNTANYSASPAIGVLPPKSTQQVVVRRFAHQWVPADLKPKEVVLVNGIITIEGLKTTNVTYDMFTPKTGRIVDEVQLDVVSVASEIISKVKLPWTLDVHPTEPWIMTTQGDYHIHIWNYETREANPIAIKGREVTSAKFIACKQWIMAGCFSGLIYVYSYDPLNKNPVKKIRVLQGHTKSVNSLAIHATEPYALSASQDGKILIWSYENEWKLMSTVDAKSLPVEDVEFNDYGNDSELMKKVRVKSLSVMQVAFNPKETNMFASAQDKTVKIWDLRSGECKLILSGHSDLVLCLDYFSLRDKLHLITGSLDRTAKIWDCKTGRCVKTLKEHMDVVKIVCCHPNLPILITGSHDGSVHLWDSNSTTFRHERTLNLHLGEVYAIASLKKSTRIAVGNEKGLALVEIDPEDKKDSSVGSTVAITASKKDIGRMIQEEVKLVELEGEEVSLAKFIARKQWILAGFTSGLLCVYSCDSQKTIHVLREHSTSIKSLAIHATKPYVLSASHDGKILLWDYGKDWQLIKTFDANTRLDKGDTVEQVMFNPKDTDTFASAQGKTVKFWNLDSGECKHTLWHSDLVLCLDYFSLGEKLYLITGSQNRTAKIWDCKTHRCVHSLKGHMDVVNIVCCHPDLPILITGSWDGSVHLWDSTTFRHELNLDLGEVYDIAGLRRSTRLERMLDFKLGKVNFIACLKGSTRIAIGLENGLVLPNIKL
ncbi:uncharacterized protein LOC119288188 isoform X2 [Triticum dicoccoides]|uniref:uncharacterized protein LOC119288188 isoform X2 n=1 Tax=Triticum dicoccoides TaxID=85692 RepID=UPI00188FB7F3|nr:uncharacterized protein LOC119288188 isoform X2 [Triticum dicoccoides]